MFDVYNFIYMLYSGHAIHVICDNQTVYKVQRLLRARSVQRADLSCPSMCLLWGHRKQDYIILALVRKSVFFFFKNNQRAKYIKFLKYRICWKTISGSFISSSRVMLNLFGDGFIHYMQQLFSM